MKKTPAPVNEDEKLHIVDGWAAIESDLSTYLYQTSTIKIDIVVGGVSMIDDFYFAQ